VLAGRLRIDKGNPIAAPLVLHADGRAWINLNPPSPVQYCQLNNQHSTEEKHWLQTHSGTVHDGVLPMERLTAIGQ
ncbi:hypothetical protein LRQ11_18745, partial [Pseudomonas sp. MAFF 311095]